MTRTGAPPFWKIDGPEQTARESLFIRSRDRVTFSARMRNALRNIGVTEDQPLVSCLLEPGMIRIYPRATLEPATYDDSEDPNMKQKERISLQEYFIRLKIESEDGRMKLPDEALSHLNVCPDKDVWLYAYVFPTYLEIWSAEYRIKNRYKFEEELPIKRPVADLYEHEKSPD